jgi:hypothetical protein
VGNRKANLRSSIYSEPDGSWRGWVTVGTKDDGSADRRHRRGRTETEVTNKVRELERKRDLGKAGKAGRPLTVEDWLETWLTTIAPRTVSQRTLGSTYEPKVRRWIVPQLGRHRLDRLQPEHLDAFYTWLAGQGLKPNTVVQIHRILSRALKIAWKRGKVGSNAASLVDAPVGEDVDIEPLTRDEARRILAAAASRRNGARWSVALAVGLSGPATDTDAITRPPAPRTVTWCHARQAARGTTTAPTAPKLQQPQPPLPPSEAAVPGRMYLSRQGMPAAHRRRLALHSPQGREGRAGEGEAGPGLAWTAPGTTPRPPTRASRRAPHCRSMLARLGPSLLHADRCAGRLPR